MDSFLGDLEIAKFVSPEVNEVGSSAKLRDEVLLASCDKECDTSDSVNLGSWIHDIIH